MPQLPPYLLRTEPMELDDLPLQVALLTMEIATLRVTVAGLQQEIDQRCPTMTTKQT